jgi:hypothetical protein
VLLNAGLFMPFGFGLASLLTWRRRFTGLMGRRQGLRSKTHGFPIAPLFPDYH